MAETPTEQPSKSSFQPLLYKFRASPPIGDNTKYALQMPFSVLFDNLIAVIWTIYTKDQPNLKIGINQMQWAIEFMKCMRVNYRYPESIGKIDQDLEKQLITLYAKVAEKRQEEKDKLEKEKEKKEEEELAEEKEALENNKKIEQLRFLDVEKKVKDTDCKRVSYNEVDVKDKLKNAKGLTETGLDRALKELNLLTKTKSKADEACVIKPTASKTALIGALQSIQTKTTDSQTKTEVEVLLKGLKTKSGKKGGSTASAGKK